MPVDSIRDWILNEESFYNDQYSLFDDWLERGDLWDSDEALDEARELARHIALSIESLSFTEGRYTDAEIEEAAQEMLSEYEEYREEAIAERMRQAVRQPTQEELEMTPEDIAHAEKYEKIAQKIGIDVLRELIPASRAKIREALERGDKHLNTIPLRKWDAAADMIRLPGLSLSEKVSALKHVATWHYA